MALVDVIRTHLELRDPAELRPSPLPALADVIRLARHAHPTVHEYRALYALVGGPWHWRDRLAWSDADLIAHLNAPAVHLWVLHVGHATAGYFELRRHADDRAEILYFGLAPDFIGRGLGGWLLTRAAEECHALGARRVILNTCTLDGPHALPNYLARGFRIVREETYAVDVSATLPAPAPAPLRPA